MVEYFLSVVVEETNDDAPR